MTVIYFNSRSLGSKLVELYDVLAGRTGQTFDIVCVTETWLTDQVSDSLLTAGHPYTVFRCDRQNRRGGGCAIFVHNKRHVRNVSFSPTYDFGATQVVCVELNVNDQVYAVCNVYNPPGLLPQCLHVLSEVFDTLCSKYHYPLFIGDFNMPNYTRDICNSVQMDNEYGAFLNTLVLYGLNQLISEPTRLNNVLDLVFCNEYLCCDVKLTPPFSNSDHCSIIVNIYIESSVDVERTADKLDFDNCDFDGINEFLNGKIGMLY